VSESVEYLEDSGVKFRLLSGIAITALMAGSAFAADMPLKAAPPPVLTYDWSGFYIGGFIGGGWSHDDSSDPGLGIIGTLVNVPVVQTTTGSAFIGGIEAGDRYQFGKLVLGWEAAGVRSTRIRFSSISASSAGLVGEARSWRGSATVLNRWFWDQPSATIMVEKETQKNQVSPGLQPGTRIRIPPSWPGS
jgi:opacity protein-like surface antigen